MPNKNNAAADKVTTGSKRASRAGTATKAVGAAIASTPATISQSSGVDGCSDSVTGLLPV